MNIRGSSFYDTPEGSLNRDITATSCAILNDELIRKYGEYGAGLIMGYGDGFLTEYFKDKFSRLVIVEGSKSLFDSAAKKYGGYAHITCHQSRFEVLTLPTEHRVDIILGNHVLEHVDDPVRLLERSKNWLKQSGYGIFSVPNADSLHRRIGVSIGMLETRYDFSDQDRLLGHQRVYDQESLLRDFLAAQYEIVEVGGFNLKLVSQNQMKDWSQELLAAIFDVSRECPADICSNLFVVCKP